MSDMECPYCEHSYEYCNDEPDSGQEHEQCPKCNKWFVFTRDWDVYYNTAKADCLNGEDHKWRQQGYPHNNETLWRCKVCARLIVGVEP